ncbi:hypothetical protein [Dietzia cinnamea]|uniref:hypothetical protein n=1 Tax=Dietzia cinnamea TaxID=321318 RepID=UPI00104FF9AD|nr:hypothetical protein [Dietzia cinnamea]
MDDAVRGDAVHEEAVRGEAARLLRRLEVARDRLDRARSERASDAAGVDRGDDDEVRALLGPAADRIARLAELAGALADGTLTEASAGEAARAVATSQPHRGVR